MLLERWCPGCGRAARFVCPDCWQRLKPAVGRAVFVYDEVGRAVVLAAKNGGRRDLFRPLGRAIANQVVEPVDVVTWVPASTDHRRRRGYDQGRLLARSTAGRLGVPSHRLLRRVDRMAQTGRNRRERLVGPVLTACRVVTGRVLVVDDVRTTGASLRVASEVLRDAGARSVTVMALASVDGPHDPSIPI